MMYVRNKPRAPAPKKPPISVAEWLRTLPPLESYKTHRRFPNDSQSEAARSVAPTRR